MPADRAAMAFLTFVGECSLLLGDASRRLVSRRPEWKETIDQMAFVGVASVPIVALTGFFSGAVLSLYLARFLGNLGGTGFVGATVVLTVAREIGPVVTGIMVAARAGSAMAAHIGTMAVTEQLDALKMLSVHPTDYLVLPRMVASILMLPILTTVCMGCGVVGGLLVAEAEGVSRMAFLNSISRYVETSDFINGLLKTPVFGLIIALVACQQGLRTERGAEGVGKSTTQAVVISIVLIYAANFLLARVLF